MGAAGFGSAPATTGEATPWLCSGVVLCLALLIAHVMTWSMWMVLVEGDSWLGVSAMPLLAMWGMVLLELPG